MPKVNLTKWSAEDQVRIVKDYLIRRKMHRNQGMVKVIHLLEHFKHRNYSNTVQKAAYLRRLLRTAKNELDKENNQDTSA